MKGILKNEGAMGFFKGMGPPLVSVPLLNSILFSSYEFRHRMVPQERKDNMIEILISGSFAGFMNSFVLTPIDLVKCRL